MFHEGHRRVEHARRLLENEKQLKALRDVERSNARTLQILQAAGFLACQALAFLVAIKIGGKYTLPIKMINSGAYLQARQEKQMELKRLKQMRMASCHRIARSRAPTTPRKMQTPLGAAPIAFKSMSWPGERPSSEVTSGRGVGLTSFTAPEAGQAFFDTLSRQGLCGLGVLVTSRVGLGS